MLLPGGAGGGRAAASRTSPQAAEHAVPGDIDDDMAIVVVRTSPEDLASWECTFPAEPIRVSEARRLALRRRSCAGAWTASRPTWPACWSPRWSPTSCCTPPPLSAPRARVRARRIGTRGRARMPAATRRSPEDCRRARARTTAARAAKEFTLRLRRGAEAVWVEVFDADLRLPRIRLRGRDRRGRPRPVPGRPARHAGGAPGRPRTARPSGSRCRSRRRRRGLTAAPAPPVSGLSGAWAPTGQHDDREARHDVSRPRAAGDARNPAAADLGPAERRPGGPGSTSRISPRSLRPPGSTVALARRWRGLVRAWPRRSRESWPARNGPREPERTGRYAAWTRDVTWRQRTGLLVTQGVAPGRGGRRGGGITSSGRSVPRSASGTAACPAVHPADLAAHVLRRAGRAHRRRPGRGRRRDHGLRHRRSARRRMDIARTAWLSAGPARARARRHHRPAVRLVPAGRPLRRAGRAVRHPGPGHRGRAWRA